MGWRGDEKTRKPSSPRAPEPSGSSRTPPPAKAEKASWRGKASDAGAGSSSRKDWQRVRTGEGASTGWQKPALFTALALFLVICFVVILLRQYTATPVIVLAVDDYAPLHWPANSYAGEDGERWNAIPTMNLRVQTPRGSVLDKALESQLKVAGMGGPDKRAVVVYLSAHGLVDAPDEDKEPVAFLLGAEAKPYVQDENDWIPVTNLIRTLEKAATAQGSKIVLLLDSGRITTNWSLGVLRQTFPELLKKECESLKNVVVIHSCSAGEENWAAPELGGSVFGYYATRGLCGDAETNDADTTVSVKELAAYITSHVSGWVKENRGRSQTPVIYNPMALELAWKSPPPPETPLPLDDWKDRLQKVDTAWKTHAELAARQLWRQRPVLWGRYEHQLLALEELTFAGPRATTPFNNILAKVNVSASNLRADLEPADVPSLTARVRIAPPRKAAAPVAEEAPAKAKPKPDEKAADKADADKPDAETTPESDKPKAKKAKPDKAADEPAEEAVAAKANVPGGGDRFRGIQWLYQLETGEALAASPAELFRDDEKGLFDAPQDSAEAWLSLITADAVDRAKLKAVLAKWETDGTIEHRFARLLEQHIDWDGGAESELAEACRLAFQARHLAELAGSAEDVRARWSVQRLTDEADKDRRLAEDKLLAGGTKRIADARQTLVRLTSSASPYWRAIEQGQILSRAWSTRDRTFAAYPWLAQWWCRSQLRAAINEQQLMDLQNAMRVLDRRLLAETDVDNADRRKQLEDAVSAVEQAWLRTFLAFEASFDTDAKRKAFDRGSTVSEALIGLGIPRRGERMDVLRKLFQRFQTPGDAVATAKSAAKAPSRSVSDFGGWSQHPANWCADYEAAEVALKNEDRGGRLAHDGYLVRHRLNQLGDDLIKRVEEKDRIDARKQMIARDARARAAGPLVLGSADEPPHEPAQHLHSSDLADWYRSQAQRAIDDFWARDANEGPHFFDVAASQYLKLADQLKFSSLTSSRPVQNALTLSRQAARSDLQPMRPDTLRLIRREVGEDQYVPAKITFTPPTTGWPLGELAFWISDEQDERNVLLASVDAGAESRRQLLPVGEHKDVSARVPTRLLKDQLAGNAGAVAIRTLFRGHEWTAPAPIVESTNNPITVARGRVPPPSITVTGESGKKLRILLVLDCSGSMGIADVRQETGSLSKRFDVAKQAVEYLIDKLPVEQVDLAFMAYGHRVGFKKVGDQFAEDRKPGTPSEVVLLTKGRQPLKSSSDVQLLTAFGQPRAALLNELAKLAPHGETPLYLAMAEALAVLKDFQDKGPGRILVVTDGLNQVSTNEARTSPAEVGRTWDRAPSVAMDVVGLKIATDAESTRSRGELLAVSGQNRQKVKFQDAATLETLKDALTKSAVLIEFAVLEDGKSVAEKAMGLKWTADEKEWIQPQPLRPHVVQLNQQNPSGAPQKLAESEVVLEGGEALELEAVGLGGETKLHHVLWRGRAGNDLIPATDTDQGPLRVSFPRPITQPDAYRFFVSCQVNTPGAFTPRPKSVWIEIRPFDGGLPVGDDVFLFTEPFYESGWPVPVLTCDIPKSLWQEAGQGADQAEIRAWLNLEAVADFARTWSVDELPIDQYQDVDVAENLKILRMPDLLTKGKSRTIRLQLQQANDPLTLNNYRLSLDPAPDRISRSVIKNPQAPQTQATVEYEFTFEAGIPDTQRVSARLTRKDAIVGANKPTSAVIRIPR